MIKKQLPMQDGTFILWLQGFVGGVGKRTPNQAEWDKLKSAIIEHKPSVVNTKALYQPNIDDQEDQMFGR